MKKFTLAMLALLLMAASVAAPAARAASLWSDSGESLFTDRRALYVGDIVTIVVNEKTNGTNKSNTSVSQDETLSAGDGTGILSKFFNAVGIESSDKYGTTGSTTSGNTLTTTISAEVVEVLPNGNLVIEARRASVVNAETQTMVLSGVIRPSDVSRENTITSTMIANLSIKYSGKGPIAKRQKPGLLNKIFDLIF
jgi:flagellar L-ring protein FlgH